MTLSFYFPHEYCTFLIFLFSLFADCIVSDQAVVQLDNQLEEATKNRDALRDELRKAKEELQKEREELEAQQKKLISKLDRTTKSKQELETIKEGSDKAHEKSLPSLTKNIIQHTTDLNPWYTIYF